MAAPLPIEDVMADLMQAMRRSGQAVLQAPPGAGKTTRVPLAMLQDDLCAGKIVMLEPRRLAARAAAERLAEQLGESVGQTVGYRIRGETQVSKSTRVEVVTEGILTRMIQSDPELAGIDVLIFDEFHERSLQADLGLALTLEVRAALREDLKLLVMSATLDAEPVAHLMGGAPVITSQGRSFPVNVKWLDRPAAKEARIEREVAELVARALAETAGSVLVFLPGEGEIRRVAATLSLPDDISVHPLYGALSFSAQRAAIAPAAKGRKVVLATSIAETSLTIEGITAVVDAGWARRARFDPGTGMSRLVTERVSRAEATQRAGRAGRLGPGVCYRAWAKAEEGGFPTFAPPEIEAADLTGLALELAAWGSDTLPFLTRPPAGALAEARRLLQTLGALTADGRVTPHGAHIARLPLHPRLAHMLMRAGPSAAPLAALLSDKDPLRGSTADLGTRLRAMETPQSAPEHARGALTRIRKEAQRLRKLAPNADAVSPEEALALAFPDRIGLRRKGDAPRWVLSGGRGAILPPDDSLANQRMIVAAELKGDGREAQVRLALPIAESTVRALYADQISWSETAYWSKRERKVLARRQEQFGALVLADQIWRDAPADTLAHAALDGVRQLGLPLNAKVKRLQARVAIFRASGKDAPDFSEPALQETAETWLLPYLSGVRNSDDIKALDLIAPLRTYLGYATSQALDQDVPGTFETPLGRQVAIDYSSDNPTIEIRLQEMFGVTRHPTVGGQPIRVTLLSPGHKPVQTTLDIPGFWASSYADVRKDMRGRYPKHPWPEDPTQADPTLRAKRRK